MCEVAGVGGVRMEGCVWKVYVSYVEGRGFVCKGGTCVNVCVWLVYRTCLGVGTGEVIWECFV